MLYQADWLIIYQQSLIGKIMKILDEFSVYDIWRFLDFLLLSVDLVWWLICIHLFKPL